MLVLVENPLAKNYAAFLETCVSKLHSDGAGIQIIVLLYIAKSDLLNRVLLCLYTQVRGLLAARGFGPETPIDVYFNLPEWRLQEWKSSKIYVEVLDSVPEDLRGARLCRIDQTPESVSFQSDESASAYSTFATAAVGGTFDHLHDGHKILLSIAAFVTKSRLIVGVTGPELLKKKKYALVLQSLDLRIKVVCEYLGKQLQNHQSYVIYQINDICGPTGYIVDIDALVISEETAEGASFVNEFREKAHLPPLAIIAAKVLGGNGNAENNWEGKISSTDLRKAEYERVNGTDRNQ